MIFKRLLIFITSLGSMCSVAYEGTNYLEDNNISLEALGLAIINHFRKVNLQLLDCKKEIEALAKIPGLKESNRKSVIGSFRKEASSIINLLRRLRDKYSNNHCYPSHFISKGRKRQKESVVNNSLKDLVKLSRRISKLKNEVMNVTAPNI